MLSISHWTNHDTGGNAAATATDDIANAATNDEEVSTSVIKTVQNVQ